jgi:hypothetical protein
LAGKWGDERRKNINSLREESRRHFTSEYQSRFSESPLDALHQLTSSPQNKFKSMQRSGFSLSSLQNPPSSAAPTSHSMANETTISKSGHLSPSRAFSPTSSSTNFHESRHDDDHRVIAAPSTGTSRSVYKESYTNHFLPPQQIAVLEQHNLHRSNSRNMQSIHVPPAIGRSGLRKERGCMTSGLSGERLNTAFEPSINSFAQRSWLYSDDPALKTKLHGHPSLERIMDRSLILPAENEELKDEEQAHMQRRLMATLSSSKTNLYDEYLIRQLEENEKKKETPYGRHYVYTGDVISKTGARRYGVFLDEHDDEVLRSVPVFRR